MREVAGFMMGLEGVEEDCIDSCDYSNHCFKCGEDKDTRGVKTILPCSCSTIRARDTVSCREGDKE